MKNLVMLDSAEFIGGKEIRILISPLGKAVIKAGIVLFGLGILVLVGVMI